MFLIAVSDRDANGPLYTILPDGSKQEIWLDLNGCLLTMSIVVPICMLLVFLPVIFHKLCDNPKLVKYINRDQEHRINV